MSQNENYISLIKTLQTNVIEWYPFEKDKSILDLSENESINNLLISKGYKVDTKTTKKYDYILFVGNLKNKINEIIKNIKNLDEGGKILLAFNNYLSIKNFCIENEEVDFTKSEIEKILDEYQFIYRRFYYGFNGIEDTNVLFTDQYMISNENVSRNIPFYSEENLILKSENNLISKMILQDKNLIKVFSNFFFIECSKTDNINNEIDFVSYSNMRKDEYKIKTVLKDNRFYKTALTTKSSEHIENIKRNIKIINDLGLKIVDKFDEGGIISERQQSETLDKVIVELFSDGKKEEAINIIKKFYSMLVEKLPKIDSDKNALDIHNIEYEIEDIKKLHFTKYGLWDMIFQNAFYINSEIVFFDQEWIEENIPIEYIMYRTVRYNENLQKYINVKELFEILNIEENCIELFSKLDLILQYQIGNDLIYNADFKQNTMESLLKEKETQFNRLRDETNSMIGQINLLKEDINNKEEKIHLLEDKIKENQDKIKEDQDKIENLITKINNMENSRLWRYTEPLRRLKNSKREKR